MTISVPATSANMGPGFDTLGVAVGLRNEAIIKPSKFTSVSIRGEGKNSSKLKGGNIFLNIFFEHFKALTGESGTFRFEFSNNIPISRGLGSSSAVIVSAVAAAYAAAGLEATREKILSLALNYEPHPDNITPAACGGFNVAAVDNGYIYSIKYDMPQELKAVVVIPNTYMSTSHSRTLLPRRYSKEDAVFNISRSSLLVAAIASRKYDLLRIASRDRFHQEYRMRSLPVLFEVQRIALESGALMSTLSGSGSSFFNLVYIDDAENVKNALTEAFPEFRVELFDFDNDGLCIK